jgi:hypothetical protein
MRPLGRVGWVVRRCEVCTALTAGRATLKPEARKAKGGRQVALVDERVEMRPGWAPGCRTSHQPWPGSPLENVGLGCSPGNKKSAKRLYWGRSCCGDAGMGR